MADPTSKKKHSFSKNINIPSYKVILVGKQGIHIYNIY